jgi:hypothetical protein
MNIDGNTVIREIIVLFMSLDLILTFGPGKEKLKIGKNQSTLLPQVIGLGTVLKKVS